MASNKNNKRSGVKVNLDEVRKEISSEFSKLKPKKKILESLFIKFPMLGLRHLQNLLDEEYEEYRLHLQDESMMYRRYCINKLINISETDTINANVIKALTFLGDLTGIRQPDIIHNHGDTNTINEFRFVLVKNTSEEIKTIEINDTDTTTDSN